MDVILYVGMGQSLIPKLPNERVLVRVEYTHSMVMNKIRLHISTNYVVYCTVERCYWLLTKVTKMDIFFLDILSWSRCVS